MLELANMVVEGLIDQDPDEMEAFVQDALSSSFDHYMDAIGTSSSWPAGILGKAYYSVAVSEKGPVKLHLYVNVNSHVGISNPQRGFVDVTVSASVINSRPAKHSGVRADINAGVNGLNSIQLGWLSQAVYRWLNGPVAKVVNSRKRLPDVFYLAKKLEADLKALMKEFGVQIYSTL